MGPFHFSSAGALARRVSGTNHQPHTETSPFAATFLISTKSPTPAIEVVVN